MQVKLAIDFENTAQHWWEAGGRDLWESIAEGFDNNSVVIEESLAQSWLSQAETIDGWHDGPEFAPHPVRLQEADDFDQE